MLEPGSEIVMDLDGTLCTQPHQTEFGDAEPIPSRIAALNALRAQGHRVTIDTARGSRSGGDWRELTERQLAEWGVEYDELRVGIKRGAEVYVDDRGMSPEEFFRDGPTLEERRARCATPGQFAREYFRHLAAVAARIDTAQVDALAREMEAARADGATVFIAANGGSAGSAAHMANGLGFHLYNRGHIGFRLHSLCENSCALTAVPNDSHFGNLFVGQLRQYYRPGDRLIVMSCSGNSKNLVNAAEWVRDAGGKVIGMLGFSGGVLADLCDLVVHVPTAKEEFGPVEDLHMAIGHVLVHWYQR